MKRTYQPNNRKKAKKHGFFSRIKGNVLKSRRAKKRKKFWNQSEFPAWLVSFCQFPENIYIV